MNKVTGEQVKAAMIAAEITYVPHHECGICGHMVHYFRTDEQLFFDGNCNCVSYYTPPRPCTWSDAADGINMQTNEAVREKIAKRFGIQENGK